MKKKIYICILVIFLFLIISIPSFYFFNHFNTKNIINKEPGKYPNEWFFKQRIYPKNFDEFDIKMMKKIINEKRNMYLRKSNTKSSWIEAGPYNIPGRITDIDGFNDTIFVGLASGGIFKTCDFGANWTSVFDEVGNLPIGDIAIHPDSHNIILAGTGEANATSQGYWGTGIYKSIDGGLSWTNIGLDSVYYIGRIVFDPKNPNKIFVAATGAMYSKNNERGVYRSIDGGSTWEKVLFISDSTSAIDIVINPIQPDTVYAAMWERLRQPGYRKSGGASSGIYRSIDGGNTWTELTNGLPPDSVHPGRIGLAISPQFPNVLYAIYTDKDGFMDSVYVSHDYGETWASKPYPDNYYSYGWYFGNIRVSPYDTNTVWVLGVNTYRSTDGGDSWSEVFNIAHVDFHAMYFTQNNIDECFIGTDGGVYFSSSGAFVDTFFDIPSMQFYQGCIDPFNSSRIYGGAQDNGTSRTNGDIYNWEQIFGGDGFYCQISQDDSNIIYVEAQVGNLYKSTDFGYSWTYIGNDFSGDRTGWSTPYIISPHNSNVLYLGTYRLYKSTNGGNNWTALSGDLTSNLIGSESVISTIDISPIDSNLIYIGTSDGNVYRSEDGGNTLISIDSTLPNRWVTRITAHPRDVDSVIICYSGFRWDENAPHVLISGDRGNTWTDISGDLPDLPVNDVIFDKKLNRIYVANDGGVLYSNNYTEYFLLGTGLPPVPVTDIDIDNTGNILYAFTYGRSAYYIDISSLSDISENNFPDTIKNYYGNTVNIKTVFRSVKEANDYIFKNNFNVYNIYGSKIKEIKTSGKYFIEYQINNTKIKKAIIILK